MRSHVVSLVFYTKHILFCIRNYSYILRRQTLAISEKANCRVKWFFFVEFLCFMRIFFRHETLKIRYSRRYHFMSLKNYQILSNAAISCWITTLWAAKLLDYCILKGFRIFNEQINKTERYLFCGMRNISDLCGK